MTLYRCVVIVLVAAVVPALCVNSPFFCGEQLDGITTPGAVKARYLDLSCTLPGATISSINFASYGTLPGGTCGAYITPSCLAENSTSVVIQSCVGKGSCRLWPNTTTYGDPCFGVAKTLVVQAECLIGPGQAQAGCASPNCGPNPFPPPPPPAPVTAIVIIDWVTPNRSVATVPSLQVVAHALLMRDSPIHNRSFALLAALNASWVRYVPWLPTPLLGVAELEPPSGVALCSGRPVPEGSGASIDCGATGGVIESITVASFGTPTGSCTNYKYGSCHSNTTTAVVSQMCVGRRSCQIEVNINTFGENETFCNGVARALVLEARCSNRTKQHTYWNFTLLDDQMIDYWEAVKGDARPQIPNFSTPPTWLYDNTSWGYNTQCTGSGPDHCTYGGYEKGPSPASAHGGLTALGDYYGRLLAWYTRGGMHDEYNEWHESGHFLNITIWEIYNEVDYEHGHTPQSYVADFDAIVAGIRRHADPNKTISFVGMSLPNIDNTATVVEWAEYFLNTSNHAVDVRDALQYIGYHSYPTSDYHVSTKDDLTKFFDYVDDFVDNKVAAVQQVVDKLSPTTITCLDESGTTGPMFGGLDDPTFWVASGSYWAYLWARSAVAQGPNVGVVGQSQFMDSPDREPGVTMIDWRSGNGTAKYWINRLVIESVSVGDLFYTTHINTTRVYAQAFTHGDSKQVLIINKQNGLSSVNIIGATSARIVDEISHQNPPRLVPITNGEFVLGAYATAIITITAPIEKGFGN